jgi:hypothetical protein
MNIIDNILARKLTKKEISMSALASVPTSVALANLISHYSYVPVKTTLISAVAGFFIGTVGEKPATFTSQAIILNTCCNLILGTTIGEFFLHPQSTEKAKGIYFMLNSVASVAISYFIHKKVLLPNITLNTPILGKIKEEEEKNFQVIETETKVKEGKAEIVNKEEFKKFPLTIPVVTALLLATQLAVILSMISVEK